MLLGLTMQLTPEHEGVETVSPTTCPSELMALDCTEDPPGPDTCSTEIAPVTLSCFQTNDFFPSVVLTNTCVSPGLVTFPRSYIDTTSKVGFQSIASGGTSTPFSP